MDLKKKNCEQTVIRWNMSGIVSGTTWDVSVGVGICVCESVWKYE